MWCKKGIHMYVNAKVTPESGENQGRGNKREQWRG
jgi:hypothetical protein